MKHKSLILALICFAILPGIWLGGAFDESATVSAQEEPPPSPEIESLPAQSIVMNVTVSGGNVGSQGGYTSPRVTLLPGDMVTVDPTGGIVDFNTNGICTGNAYDASPGGKPRSEIYQGSCWDPDLNSCQINQNDPLPGQNHAGLFRPSQPGIGSIKWIGNNNDTFTYTGTTARDLRLGVNDVACSSSPNAGSFSVKVTIKRPQVQTVNVVIRGSNTATSEVVGAPLVAGDQVVIDNISGTVDFLTDAVRNPQCPYVVNANGLARDLFENPQNQLLCDYQLDNPADPMTGPAHGHAGLYMKRNSTRTFIGRGGASFTATVAETLRFGVNDVRGDNNSGQFNARVTITHPTSKQNVVVEGYSVAGSEEFVTNLMPGDDVLITNITGTVTFEAPLQTCVNSGLPYTVNANGLNRSVYENPNHLPCYGNDRTYGGDPLIQANQGHAGLYMKRGSGRYFIGTSGASFTALTAQSLSLGVNDGYAANNSGRFRADVIITRSGSFNFSAATYSVDESGTSAVINVTRTIPNGAASVTYATSNRTAVAGQDYTARSGVLNFADGELTKSFTVPITNDAADEPDETVNLSLSNPTGNFGIGRATAILTINDNDAAGNNAAFVAQMVPTQMTAGRPYTVSVTMRNTGGTTWQPGVWKLGAENPRDNGTWGINRIQLDNPVAPNETATFEFVVTAPSAPGTYNFQRRMLQEGYQWF
ncbi:MAG TPA: Calx-beta domain-containing protein, partial [Pyrinomonadaceae bacterium]